MSEQGVREVVEAFFDATEARDFERAELCLSPTDFSYESPIDTFHNAHEFIADISRVGPITKRIERRKLFVDGDEVCAIYNFITTMDALANTRVAQWMKIKEGQIVWIEVFFDAHAYASMFESGA
jgi:ketosteroid isomerase-like protein